MEKGFDTSFFIYCIHLGSGSPLVQHISALLKRPYLDGRPSCDSVHESPDCFADDFLPLDLQS